MESFLTHPMLMGASKKVIVPAETDAEWIRSLGRHTGSDQSAPKSGYLDKDTGMVYVTEQAMGTYKSGAQYSNVGNPAAIRKINQNGGIEWLKKHQLENTDTSGWNRDQCTCVTTDSEGNVITAGYTKQPDGNAYAPFVLKLDENGSIEWAKLLGPRYGTSDYYGRSRNEAVAISCDSSDNIYVMGEKEDGSNGGSGSNTERRYLLKLNSSGTEQWWKTLHVNKTSNEYYGDWPYLWDMRVVNSTILVAMTSGSYISLSKHSLSDGSVSWHKYFTYGTSSSDSNSTSTINRQSLRARRGTFDKNGVFSWCYSGKVGRIKTMDSTEANNTWIWLKDLDFDSSVSSSIEWTNSYKEAIGAVDNTDEVIYMCPALWGGSVMYLPFHQRMFSFNSSGTVQWSRIIENEYMSQTSAEGTMGYPIHITSDDNGHFYLFGTGPMIPNGTSSYNRQAVPHVIKHKANTALPTGNFGNIDYSTFTTGQYEIENFTPYTVSTTYTGYKHDFGSGLGVTLGNVPSAWSVSSLSNAADTGDNYSGRYREASTRLDLIDL